MPITSPSHPHRSDTGAKDPPTHVPGRLLVVSNRLPFAVEFEGDEVRSRRTVGGLVSGVDGYLHARAEAGSVEGAWVGWPGVAVDEGDRARVRAAIRAEQGAFPVFLDGDDVARFYDGFCNGTLWPLLHYFPALVRLEERDWAAYVRVNERFRDAVLEALEPGDTVWVHDYQLMLLPGLLRAARPDVPIAYFLHVPFPAFEVFRILPDAWSRALIHGVLGADVVGLHTLDYVRHFLRSAERLAGVETSAGEVRHGSRVTSVDAFPIGIDFAKFATAAEQPDVTAALEALRGPLGERRVVLSVDRLDYTKGICGRLAAFELFLERSPAWRGRVTLVVIAVPSRERVESYQLMRTQIEQAVGRINGRFGSVAWAPVVYQFRALDFADLAALYLRADVALVTPLRDGMNLVAKEYLATRADESGVLVLSDTAGAARELGEAILVNPYHPEGLSEAIGRALELPVSEQRASNRIMRARLRRYDVARWGNEQFERLARARAATRALRERRLGAADRRRLTDAFVAARRRLVLLDYDGTLVPFTAHPSAAAPAPEVRGLLARLAATEGTDLVLVSGRDASTLEAWLGDLPLALVAEHGARLRERGGEWERPYAVDPQGQERVIDLMQRFTDRLPGSFVERKDISVAWHWRSADPDIGAAREVELVEALTAMLQGGALSVLRGKRVVEVRGSAAHKGAAARRWLGRGPYDIVLAAGDDATDEDLFAALPAGAWSLRVGAGDSRAAFNVDDPEELRGLLDEVVEAARRRANP
jgi:trehalose 6-phosphate synthase/phosphatase